MKKLMMAVGLSLSLAACGSVTTPPVVSQPVVHEVVVKSVTAAMQALTLTENVADRYARLPRCGRTTARICSDPAIIAQIRDADNKAYAAVMAAKHNQASVEFAWSMVENLQRVIPQT